MDLFHQHLNGVEPSIRFTMETEEGGCLPFLDTEVTRHLDGSLTTKVHRKKTNTDKYLDFCSHHPLAHKLAVVRTLLTRADRLCSSTQDCVQEKSRVATALERNGYPRRLLTWTKPFNKETREEDEEPKAVVVLPYVRGVSEGIRRALKKVNIKTCFRPHRNLSQLLVHPKDPVPPEQRRGVVYRIPCGSCDMTYVGQTGRTLDQRRKEHWRALVNCDTNLSALAEHALERDHAIAWGEATVLDCNKHVHQRCALESWHIRQQQEPMNRERGLLPIVYDSLIF